MQRKPIILILTSRDEKANISKQIAQSIRKVGTHNVVIVSDEGEYGYGSAQKMSKLDRLLSLREEYQQVLAEKSKRKHSATRKRGRDFRIANAVKRYRPELVLAVTPYSYFALVEAKKKTNFKTSIFYIMPYFVLDKQTYDEVDTTFIVENQDIKSALVQQGVPSRRVHTMGLPYEIDKKTPIEISALKQELGLPKTLSIFLNAGKKDGVEEMFRLLLDQGDIINTVVYAGDNKLSAELRSIADGYKANNVVVSQKEDQFDEYLTACDVVVTKHDIATIYKAFKLGKPVIVMSTGEHSNREIEYLVHHGLVMHARENIEIVGLMYRLIETGVAATYVRAGEKWVENANIDTITNYLVSYMRT
ncbi:MAG: hypothetical protein J6S32_03885 [Clostridia bacterium]|nr:hypothetical protein [Clostridia bacterium]